jgi:hypothetical protein
MKSIKFTPEMVQAILNGQKTQTRRPIKSECPYSVGETLYVQDNLHIKITDIRAERLQAIEGAEAIMEGAVYICGETDEFTYHSVLHLLQSALSHFQFIWESIYGNQPGKRWEDNPFVWVYEFEAVEELE